MDQRQEKLVDEAVEETFPASDPISPKRIRERVGKVGLNGRHAFPYGR